MNVRIYFDGACNNLGNPPLMGIGVAVFVNDARCAEWDKSYCHGSGTNNIAEWEALKAAMTVAVEMVKANRDITSIKIFGDSQIIVYQYTGEYEIKQHKFIPYYNACRSLKDHITGRRVKLQVGWIKRELNKEADVLSKRGIIPVRPKDKL